VDKEDEVVFTTKTILSYLELRQICKSYPLVAKMKTVISGYI